ncbi:hypothetical protein EV426DRAFT_700534 [Tirmania nivea]|nr:hypothetical protein EV426DRAFT_700534 [Tirmania nivea]
MSAAMVSISVDAFHLRDMLFDLSKPVTISPETSTMFGHMLIQFTPSFSQSCCKHMWEAHIGMFAEYSMEVYETVGTVWVEEEGSRRNVERANIVIRVRESFEQVQQQLYTAYEMMDPLNCK